MKKTITVHLGHGDRNLVAMILEDGQSNLTTEGKQLMKLLDTSIGVSLPNYPVDMPDGLLEWLNKEIGSFEQNSKDRVLKFLTQDSLPLLKAKLANAVVANISHRASVNYSIASRAFTSAVLSTLAVCLVVWAVIECVNY